MLPPDNTGTSEESLTIQEANGISKQYSMVTLPEPHCPTYSTVTLQEPCGKTDSLVTRYIWKPLEPFVTSRQPSNPSRVPGTSSQSCNDS